MTSEQIQAIVLSLKVSTLSVLLILPIAICLGWILARKEFIGKSLLETVINLPLVLPPVVTGYLLLLVLGRQGVIGHYFDKWLGIHFVFDWKGATIAAAVVSFPLMVRTIRIAFEAIDYKYEKVAKTLGANSWDVFLTVTIPLAKHGIIAGCMLAFARSLGEFGATVLFAGNVQGETQTISLYVYEQLQTPGGLQEAYTVVCFSIVIACLLLFISELLIRRTRINAN